jgi:protein SCO1/2
MPARLRLTLFVAAVFVLLAAAGVMLLGGGGEHSASAGGLRGSLRPDHIPPKDFTLRDQDGRPASLRAYRGQVVILTFMYSTCRDTCPLTAQQIRQALDDVGHDVPALAVSVDPRNDDPARAKAFLLRQHMTGRMRFLVGTQATLEPVWGFYGVQPQTKAFDHSASVVLIDKQGRQRESFPVQQLVPEDLAHDIEVLQRAAA